MSTRPRSWRGRVPMEPADFVPELGGQAPEGEVLPGRAVASRCRAPRTRPRPAVEQGLSAAPAPEPFTLPLLGGMLRDSYGLIGRRLGVQANTDLARLPFYARRQLVARHRLRRRPLPVQRLLGRRARRAAVCPACTTTARPPRDAAAARRDVPPRSAPRSATRRHRGTDQFLVLGVKFWQNAFKYNSFSYHAVTMDVGTLLQTWRMWAGRRGLRIDPRTVVRRGAPGPAARGATGRGGRVRRRARSPGRPCQAAEPTGAHRRAVARAADRAAVGPATDQERSRARPDLRHGAPYPRAPPPSTRRRAARPPGPGRGRPRRPCRGAAAATLPAARPLRAASGAALRAPAQQLRPVRRQRPITAAELRPARRPAPAGAALRHATSTTPGRRRLVKLYVFVNHVDGVAPGSYEYDPRRPCAAAGQGRARPARSCSATTSWPTTTWSRPPPSWCPPCAPPPCSTRSATAATASSTPLIGAVAQAVYTACARAGTRLRRGARLRQHLLHRGAGPRPGRRGPPADHDGRPRAAPARPTSATSFGPIVD